MAPTSVRLWPSTEGGRPVLPYRVTAPLAAARPTGPGYCGVSTAVLAQSSRVAPLFLGGNADAKTSPAPPTAVLITRRQSRHQKSCGWAPRSVLSRGWGKNWDSTQVPICGPLRTGRNLVACWATTGGPATRARLPRAIPALRGVPGTAALMILKQTRTLQQTTIRSERNVQMGRSGQIGEI